MIQASLQRVRPLLGTYVDISASGDVPEEVNEVMLAAFAKIERIHRLMSYQDSSSELSRINREAHAGWVWVSPELSEVLHHSRRIATVSGGLFDPTVAPVLCGMGYLPRHKDAPRPSGQGDWRDIVVEGRRVRFSRRIRIDLGGIAKGYAVDCALAILRDAGMRAARVNAGGDLALFAPQPEDVHVRHPRNPSTLLRLLQMREGAVATSAGYHQACRRGGRWVTPLVNPHTRECLCLKDSVSVVAKDCMTADALTKVVAADLKAAPECLRSLGAQAIRLEPDEQVLRMFSTDRQSGVWQSRWLPEGGQPGETA